MKRPLERIESVQPPRPNTPDAPLVQPEPHPFDQVHAILHKFQGGTKCRRPHGEWCDAADHAAAIALVYASAAPPPGERDATWCSIRSALAEADGAGMEEKDRIAARLAAALRASSERERELLGVIAEAHARPIRDKSKHECGCAHCDEWRALTESPAPRASGLTEDDECPKCSNALVQQTTGRLVCCACDWSDPAPRAEPAGERSEHGGAESLGKIV